MKRSLFAMVLLVIVWNGVACSEPASVPADSPDSQNTAADSPADTNETSASTQGVPAVATLTKFEVVDIPELLVVGKRISDYADAQPMELWQLWNRTHADRIFKTLEGQEGFVYDKSRVGFRYGPTDAEYIVGLLMKPGAAVPEGFSCHTLPPGKAALCWVKGKNLFDVISNTDRLVGEAFEKAGLRQSTAWRMELYSPARNTTDENGGFDVNSEMVVDWYIPIEK